MRSLAPVGAGYERVSAKKRDNAYRRGGATKKDVRTRMVDDVEDEYKALVGVSQKRAKVGWRTHFIVLGIAGKYRAKAGPRPFLDDALDSTRSSIESNAVSVIELELEKAISKAGL